MSNEKKFYLTAISISSVLSFVWMAENPPISPNLTKAGEENIIIVLHCDHNYIIHIYIQVTSHLLDSPSQPANHEAPETENLFSVGFTAMWLQYDTHKLSDSCCVSDTPPLYNRVNKRSSLSSPNLTMNHNQRLLKQCAYK